MLTNLRKTGFVERIAQEAHISNAQAEKAYEALLGGIQDALIAGDKVTLTGFGTFTTADRKPRMGRNPQTGAPIAIAGRRVPRFAAGKTLKDSIAQEPMEISVAQEPIELLRTPLH